MPRTKKSQTANDAADFRDTIISGDCISEMKVICDKTMDLIFADPPYNLQLQNDLWRPNLTLVDAVRDKWDQFQSFQEYDEFTTAWLSECHRILKDDGTIWVIGSYHNIFRVGKIMMDLGFWILNDVIWHKMNPMPNFKGTRFQSATETLIWAKKSQKQKKYQFNYHIMKNLNDEKQMQNVWQIPLCTGEERVKKNGKKAHSTQKPEQLLYRVIASSSAPGDLVFDPFLGSGTTGAVAKKLGRHFFGIEIDNDYVEIARERIASIPNTLFGEDILLTRSKRDQPRVKFASLLEAGYLQAGQYLFSKKRKHSARIKADSTLLTDQGVGSIHRAGALVQDAPACNGWDFWYFEDENGILKSIDVLRQQYIVKEHEEVED